MADGTTKIVLNAVETMDDVSGRLREFLRYVAGESSSDEYIQKLDDAVKKREPIRNGGLQTSSGRFLCSRPERSGDRGFEYLVPTFLKSGIVCCFLMMESR